MVVSWSPKKYSLVLAERGKSIKELITCAGGNVILIFLDSRQKKPPATFVAGGEW
jgi:hypothetical protein